MVVGPHGNFVTSITMTKKIQFGIIGCSRIAESSTLPALSKSKLAELCFVGSRSAQKAEAFAKKFNCKKYGSYEEVLEDKNVQAVYVSLPVGLHEEWAIKSAKAGKHVLCEKSSTTSYTSAKKMVKTTKQNEVRLMEGFMFRFHPSHKKVLEIIKNGTIGDLFTFYSAYGFPAVDKADIRFKKELGGGILNDAGCYPICASRIIFNKEPIETTCKLVIDTTNKVDTKAIIQLSYGRNRFAQMSTGYELNYENMYSVWGSKGCLKLSRAYNIPADMHAILIVNSTDHTNKIKIQQADHFLLMLDAFSSELLSKNSSDFNFENDLLQQARVMEAARLSAKKNQTIRISDIK